MKNLCLCLTTLLFVSSCSTEPKAESPLFLSPNDDFASTMQRNTTDVASNINNPYDIAGELHNEILFEYHRLYPVNKVLDSINGRVMAIANSLEEYNDIKDAGYQEADIQKIQSLLSSPETSMSDTIGQSDLSTSAKSDFTAFCNDFFALMTTEGDYATIHESICSYEAGVISNPLLTVNDKKLILTTTSIARFTAKPPKKKPKKNTDLDWTIWIGNLMGALYGAQSSTAEAISTALITGISQN